MNGLTLSMIALLASMFSIQLGASLAKQLFPMIGPEGATTLRLAFAALTLALVWRPWTQRLKRREFLYICFYGISLGGMNSLFYLALERLPLGIAVALEFLGPLGVAVFSSRRGVDLLWAALAGVGIMLLLPIFHTEQRLDPLGIFYVLIAALFWGLYIIFGQKVGSTALHSGKVTALGMVIASLVGIPSGVLHRGTLLLRPEVIPLGFLMAILSSAIPYSLEMVALKKLPAKTFGILMSLEPVVGALIGFLYLKEQLSWSQWAAIVLVISASMGSSLAVAKS